VKTVTTIREGVGAMDTIGLELINAAEAEEKRHAAYRATAPSLADNMASFRRFLDAAIAVQTHFNLTEDSPSFTWDDLREMCKTGEDV
jgi:hypothetical protein